MKPRAGRQDRRSRILNAAEAAFAEQGYEGASLRDIVARARVNLPTVYYYFGSKAGLLEAVFQRRFGPLREEHWELLRQADAQAGGRPLTVEAVVEAMLLPPLRLAAHSGHAPAVMRLIGRLVTEPDSRIQEMIRQLNHDLRQEFVRRLALACPQVSEPELRWRVVAMWGALGYLLGNPQHLLAESGGRFDLRDTPRTIQRLTAYFAAAFRSPQF